MPTHYFLSPIYQVAVTGAAPADVLVELAVDAAICVALVPAVAALGRRANGSTP